jgi:hypothetical protein
MGRMGTTSARCVEKRGIHGVSLCACQCGTNSDACHYLVAYVWTRLARHVAVIVRNVGLDVLMARWPVQNSESDMPSLNDRHFQGLQLRNMRAGYIRALVRYRACYDSLALSLYDCAPQ